MYQKLTADSFLPEEISALQSIGLKKHNGNWLWEGGTDDILIVVFPSKPGFVAEWSDGYGHYKDVPFDTFTELVDFCKEWQED
jgi:hypothetical protein